MGEKRKSPLGFCRYRIGREVRFERPCTERSKGLRTETSLKKREDGFSLIELLVVLSLIAIMSTIAMTSYQGYDKAQDHRGATREVVGFLRNSQVRAVAEATTFQCVFTTSQLRIYRDGTVPATSAPVRTYSLTEPRFNGNLEFVTASPNGFQHASGLLPNCLFYARGSATSGVIEVRRKDTGAEHEITVEGLTARVAYQD